jgi:hypothetical protein
MTHLGIVVHRKIANGNEVLVPTIGISSESIGEACIYDAVDLDMWVHIGVAQ